jgi:hypothetical protein
MEKGAYEIEIGYYKGPLERVLAGLEDARLEGAVLELDGDSKELRAFIDERTRDRPALAEANRRRGVEPQHRFGPISFGRDRSRELPIEGDTFAVLRDMLERHADAEIAIELNVRDEEGYLVEAPDVGDNTIWVGHGLSEHALDALRAALGDGLRPPRS